MTLPVVPGNPMSFSQINTELGLSSTATISLNDAAVRTLAGVGASPATIAISNLSGKSNTYPFTISSNQTNANLRTLAVNAGWPGTAKVVATINSGIYISSNSTGTAALTINGAFPNGVELINNGFIIGMGGNGGVGKGQSFPSLGPANGSAGGLALAVSVATTITNGSGTIGGGGGGGGGGGENYVQLSPKSSQTYEGGGGGGGRSSQAANSSGGAGETSVPTRPPSAGSAGTVSAAGPGGPGVSGPFGSGGNGGAGGNWGAAGSTGGPGAGGGKPNGSGGGGGGAITGNSNITYVSTGTRLGSIS